MNRFILPSLTLLLGLTAPLQAQVVLEGTANFGGNTYFNVPVDDATYNVTPTSFDLGTADTDRMLIVPVAWRNSTINSITFGGQALSLAGSVTNTSAYALSYYYLPETGLALASGNEFVITMAADANTSLIFQGLVLSNAEQTPPLFTSATATGQNPPDVPSMTLSSLAPNGFAFTSGVIQNSAGATLGSIDTSVFAWNQDLANQAFDAHTGGKLSTATLAFAAGGSLTADWQGGAASGGQDTYGGLLYVNAVPEPATALLLILGLMVVTFSTRRCRA